MFDLVFVLLCVTGLLALLACAARREARESRASLSGLHSRRQAAVLQEGRRPRR